MDELYAQGLKTVSYTHLVVSVKTGDSLDIMPYALGTLLGIASLSGMLIKRKRSRM